MNLSGNAIYNKDLEALSQRAGADVTAAIHKASTATGVDFAYLMEKAAAESSFDTDAQAKTSSARGLYQFIERTWLQMVKDHGAQYGLGDYADKISDNYKVTDKAARKEILALRDDPQIASYMAAEFAADNKAYMQQNLDKGYGDIGATEMYFAHFLGAGQATAFLNAMKDNPLQAAADLFPKAAKANYNVFYNAKTGQAKSLAQVYAFFDKKFGSDGSIDTDALRANRLAPGVPSRKPDQFKTLDANGDGLRIQPRPQFIATRDLEFGEDDNTMSAAGSLWTNAQLSMAKSSLSLLSDEKSRDAVPTGGLITDPITVMTMAQLSAPGETAANAATHQRKKDDDDNEGAHERIMRPRLMTSISA